MKIFNNLLKKYLTDYNSNLPIDECSVMHEQFVITEKKGAYYIFLQNKIVGHAKSLVEAKQRCDTINSGC
jgi:hypothetical protein